MKKLLAIVLAAACAVSMAACAAKTGGIITLPEASMADGQLAAPPEVTSVPYPKDTDFVKDGKVDYSGYDKACDDWQAARQERLQTMVDPADVAHWFTSSIPVLLQGAGDENRVCSPLNVYMALAMLAAVTDGQTQGQILDALGADSLDVVDLVMTLEDEFDIEIPDEDIEKIHTVGELAHYLEEHIDG